MTQDQLILLVSKGVLLADLTSIIVFIATYTKLAPWWSSQIGRTIVIKDILLVLILIPSILSLFFSFNRFTSHIAAWINIVLLAALVPIMLWRTQVWVKLKNQGDTDADSDSG